MANPMPGENKVWERIKKENIVIDHDVWEMINHYVRNGLMVISSGWQELRFEDDWSLKAASVVLTVLGKLTTPKGTTPKEFQAMCDIIQEISRAQGKVDPDKINAMCDAAIDWENDKLSINLVKLCNNGIRWTKDTDNFLRKLHEITDKGDPQK